MQGKRLEPAAIEPDPTRPEFPGRVTSGDRAANRTRPRPVLDGSPLADLWAAWLIHAEPQLPTRPGSPSEDRAEDGLSARSKHTGRRDEQGPRGPLTGPTPPGSRVRAGNPLEGWRSSTGKGWQGSGRAVDTGSDTWNLGSANVELSEVTTRPRSDQPLTMAQPLEDQCRSST